MGITTKLIYSWKAKLEAQEASNVLNEDERAELKRLRKENKDLKMEKEILKKASVGTLQATPSKVRFYS